MNFNNDIIEDKQKLKEIVKLICNNMLKTRPEKEIEYIPYRRPEFMERSVRNCVVLNLGDFFGEYECGDYAYVSTSVLSQDNSLVTLSTKKVSQVLVNGEVWEIPEEKRAYAQITFELEKGYNEIVMKCEAEAEAFKIEYTVGHVYYPWLWTCDYLLWVKDTVPMKEYIGEQGVTVSELVKKDEIKSVEACEIIYPMPPIEDNIVDFNKLYANESGNYAVSYTYVKEKGTVCIRGENIKVIKNNTVCGNVFEAESGDIICVVSKRSDNRWGFECDSNSILYLPFLSSKRTRGNHWIHIGAFNDDSVPELKLDSLYKNADGNSAYWRFSEKDVYLRPYLDTSFFGQWFYGLMVGEYGLMRAGEFFEKYHKYFRKSMGVIIDYYEYIQYDASLFGSPTFLKRSIMKDDLDSIGTIGMNLCEIYNIETDEKVKEKIMHILKELVDSMYKNIPRMPDESFCRHTVVWADDMYMSCPFLVRMGNITGNTDYYDEAVKQLLNYTRLLYINKEGIFAHIYYIEEEANSNIPWGRGNGWMYLSLAEVIEHLPDGYRGKSELEEIFRQAVKNLVKFQDKDGMWHQVINMPESYSETSCTAIFAIAIGKGIKMGLLDSEVYTSVLKKAVSGLLDKSVDEKGNIFGVCRGSGSSKKAEYYAKLGTILNDDHGTGVVIAALCELIEFQG